MSNIKRFAALTIILGLSLLITPLHKVYAFETQYACSAIRIKQINDEKKAKRDQARADIVRTAKDENNNGAVKHFADM